MAKLLLDLTGQDVFTPTEEKTFSRLSVPWVEKYRPKKVENIILDKEVNSKIKEIIKSGKMPNLIIAGPPGTGKTSTALCIAKSLLGSNYQDGVIELNASDNRGLEIFKNSIIDFCKKKLDCHKIVILDEADNITQKAQNVLTNLMERYAHNTRFVLTCNNIRQINESVQSRCIILRYNRMSNDNIKKRLIHICKKEKVRCTRDGMEALIFIAQGDIRRAINVLESCHNGYEIVSSENIYKISDQPPSVIIEVMVRLCQEAKLKEAIEICRGLKYTGYCSNDIILTLLGVLKKMDISDETRIEFTKIVSMTYITVNDGVDTDLQLYGCLARLCKKSQGIRLQT